MQPRKKIVNISAKSSKEEMYPTRHSVKITYDDKSHENVSLDGKQLSDILARNFSNLSLNGPSLFGNFTLEAIVSGRLGSKIHRETLKSSDVVSLFNYYYPQLIDDMNYTHSIDVLEVIDVNPVLKK